MKEISINREKMTDENKVIIKPFLFRSPDEAMRFIETASPVLLEQMADVYREAFAEEPWYERFKCPTCDSFRKDSCCPACGTPDLPEAYPKEQLIREYFPSMLTGFSPSVLTVGYKKGKVIGFCTGGNTDLTSLVEKKYKGSAQILDDICKQTGLSPWQIVFYENEACIRPAEQRKGMGTQLSNARMATVITQISPDSIFCGRSINPNWLKQKRTVFLDTEKLPYRYVQFVPEGDTFEVNGLKRMFYMGIPDIKQNRLPNYMLR